ncbi:MAG TPA: helix-turn-helix domain-containing protein [Polyangiaceae bacterium]|nr:helix-turn-helix domain-containing protein [Polyangiaceae bacterium]
MTPPADEFLELFPVVYLRFCRRPDKHEQRLTPQMSAILHHLALSGPLTIGEMSRHFDRAQSVVSEIVNGLERKRLLKRLRDERDRRRTLTWLTDEAHEVMRREQQVLDRALVSRAMEALGEPRASALVDGMRALVASADGSMAEKSRKKEKKA